MEKVNDKIYARNCHYNAVRMMNEIYDLVKSKGGYLVSDWQKDIKLTDVHNRQVKDMPVITTPFWGCSTCYMTFYLDGYVYYLEFPENIFDTIKCGKISVNDELISPAKYCCSPITGSSETINKLYILTTDNIDCIKSVAQDVFHTMLNMYPNPHIVTEERQVPNTYDGGYHTEYVPVKYIKKYIKID